MTQPATNIVRLAILASLGAACVTNRSGTAISPATVPSVVSGVRVIQSSSGAQVSFDQLIVAASAADVVFFGEQHDDPETHFAEFALLEGIGRRRSHVILSLEMFERDVQPMVDDYLASRMSEADFLARSRPWPAYERDYRALVLLAKARGWSVIAANTPRPIASAVSRRGLAVLDTLPAISRTWVARDISCPHDAYYARFTQEMTGHGAGGGPPAAADAQQALLSNDRFYEAQCIKDETMGESVARASQRSGDGSVVVHFDGAFHSDFRQGTVARAMSRLPTRRSLVITAVPVADPASAPIGDAAMRADYLIFTRAKPGG